MKLGKKPATPATTDFKLARYLMGALPKRPASFGHEGAVKSWGVLGNDQYGDCVFAGAAHETMVWNASAGKAAQFTPECVLSDYAAVTGFNPADPNTDQGTDVGEALSYRRKTGIVDASGQRHKIGAYVSINPKKYDEFLTAVWLFGAVGIGIQFPTSAMTQFNGGKPWTVSKAPIDGGHYIPVIADRKGRPVCVTWGKTQPMTKGFFLKYCDEAYALLSEEMLAGGKSPEGFDLASLQSDLKAL